jgi:two-component system, OmpR family, response regulator
VSAATEAASIAVVDDDAGVRETVVDVLLSGGFPVIGLSGGAALQAWMNEGFVPLLVVLDLQLPDADGLALAARLRATSNVPIIMLTGRGSDIDRIVGLEIGADDYMVKPFSARELLARVKAVLRRTGTTPQDPAPSAPVVRRGLRFQGFTLDLDGRRLFDPQGSQISLTVAEFDLLAALASASGRVLTRNQLLDMTRADQSDVFDRTIDVLILRLRRKIETNAHNPRLIRTERGLGYAFEGPVELID